MMPRRFSTRGLRKHRPYHVADAARTIGACRATVLRWIRSGELPAVVDSRPFLICGDDLIAFLKARRRSHRKSALDEAFCVKCRAFKHPDFGTARITIGKGGRPQLRGFCESCGTAMMKPIARGNAIELAAILAGSHKQAG